MISCPRPTRVFLIPRWGLLGLLGLLTLGILGMHGMSAHGMSAQGQPTRELLAAGAPRHDARMVSLAGRAPEAHHSMDAALATSDADGQAPLLPAGEAGGAGPAMAELCVAVLLGSAALLLLVRAAHRRARWLRPALRRVLGPPPPARAAAPPSLAGLSLLRC